VPQEDIPASTPQRSSTETGRGGQGPEGARPRREAGGRPGSTPQRSSTPEGQAEPKPKVRGAEVQQARRFVRLTGERANGAQDRGSRQAEGHDQEHDQDGDPQAVLPKKR
jgi:hypothetical protein